MTEKNLSMLTDFYELTMANGYLSAGMGDTIAYFDVFFRQIPDNGGYAIMAGVQQAVDYLENLHFNIEDIEYLRGKGCFSEKFLEYLRNFEFKCDIWAIDEGMPIFPNEPIVTVRGPIIQAQLIETMLLTTINHQSLIATKAHRIASAARGRAVLEFGARRAHSAGSALYGARAAYIGGCAGSSCVLADELFGVPAGGTMAHSWIQMFDSEYEAFAQYAKIYPDNCVFLVDTYNVLKSGVPNVIKVANEVLAPMGKRPKGIRIDSGDIAYLSKAAREMLDNAGFEDVKISISNSLDEWVIRELLLQGAKIDSFGVGERLITASSEPVFGGVYKLAAVESNGGIIPKIKVSENVSKITIPHFKQVYRLFDNDSGKAIADVITLRSETIENDKTYKIFHPVHTWKHKILQNFHAEALLKPVFEGGKNVHKKESVSHLREFCARQTATLWEEVRRIEKPQKYIVDLSKQLWTIRDELLKEHLC